MSQLLPLEPGTARPGTETGPWPAVFVTLAVVQSAPPAMMDAMIRQALQIEGPIQVAEQILTSNRRLRVRADRPLAFELYLVVAVRGTVSAVPILDHRADRVALAAWLRGAGLPLRDAIPFLDSVGGYQVVADAAGRFRVDAAPPAPEMAIAALPPSSGPVPAPEGGCATVIRMDRTKRALSPRSATRTIRRRPGASGHTGTTSAS